MKRHTEAVQHSSKACDWRTPPACFAALNEEFAFTLDCAADRQNKLCGHYFGLDHDDPALRDALAVDWMAYLAAAYSTMHLRSLAPLTAFMNPPYSRELKMPVGVWCQKAYEESLKGLTIVGVIPYAPQTEWWREWVEGHDTLPASANGQTLVEWSGHAASETRKIPHRVSFLRPDGSEEGNAGGNTAIVCWKPRWGRVGPWVPYAPYWSWK